MATRIARLRLSTTVSIVLGCLAVIPASAEESDRDTPWLISGVVSHEQTAPLEAVATRGRQPALSLLFASYATLNVLDVHSTLRATGRGAPELNPMIGALSDSPAALAAVKIGVTALTVYSCSRLARKHPKAALLTMLAVNSIYATVVASNYRVASVSKP